jgi:bifunctional DNase/RNase
MIQTQHTHANVAMLFVTTSACGGVFMLGALVVVAGLVAQPVTQPAALRPTSMVEARTAPAGFLEMFVATVMPRGDGHTVVLVSPTEELLLPVEVALPEAVTIYGRLEHKRAPSPMTHDVLDNVVSALGGTVVRVQIDRMVDDSFSGVVVVRTRAGADVAIDARAADALAMALSAHAPIFVSRPVVTRAALTHDDIQRMSGNDGPPPDAAGTRTFDL